MDPENFIVKDCTIITRMAGIASAMTLRELRERLRTCSIECIYHHFCEILIRSSFDDPEYRNDFAVWASRYLRDRILAERLGILDPYKFNDLEDLRQKMIEIMDQRLSELPYIPFAKKGEDFYFMQATTLIFQTGIEIKEPEELIKSIAKMTNSTIYYHFIDSRRRNPFEKDDFSIWLIKFGEKYKPLLKAWEQIDFYFYSLPELKKALVDAFWDIKEEIQSVK